MPPKLTETERQTQLFHEKAAIETLQKKIDEAECHPRSEAQAATVDDLRKALLNARKRASRLRHLPSCRAKEKESAARRRTRGTSTVGRTADLRSSAGQGSSALVDCGEYRTFTNEVKDGLRAWGGKSVSQDLLDLT